MIVMMAMGSSVIDSNRSCHYRRTAGGNGGRMKNATAAATAAALDLTCLVVNGGRHFFEDAFASCFIATAVILLVLVRVAMARGVCHGVSGHVGMLLSLHRGCS